MPTPGGQRDGRLARKRSILDYVDKRYAALSAKLGRAIGRSSTSTSRSCGRSSGA